MEGENAEERILTAERRRLRYSSRCPRLTRSGMQGGLRGEAGGSVNPRLEKESGWMEREVGCNGSRWGPSGFYVLGTFNYLGLRCETLGVFRASASALVLYKVRAGNNGSGD